MDVVVNVHYTVCTNSPFLYSKEVSRYGCMFTLRVVTGGRWHSGQASRVLRTNSFAISFSFSFPLAGKLDSVDLPTALAWLRTVHVTSSFCTTSLLTSLCFVIYCECGSAPYSGVSLACLPLSITSFCVNNSLLKSSLMRFCVANNGDSLGIIFVFMFVVVVELFAFIVLFHYAILLALNRFSEEELRCNVKLVLFVLPVATVILFRLNMLNLLPPSGLGTDLFSFLYKYSILSVSKTSFVKVLTLLLLLL